MGDGCSVNVSSSNKVTNRYGFVTTLARCSSHAVDGNIKRMSYSENHSVEEVGEDILWIFSHNPATFSAKWKTHFHFE